MMENKNVMSASSYNQNALEKKWQKNWQETKIYHFDFNSDKKPYSIDVPPRYASGPLHAGHAVHYTHIDFAARYKRMKGYNVFFPLCFDVNGIPIEDLANEDVYAEFPRGFIGLQVHRIRPGRGPYEVAWRNIRIREF